MKRKREDGNKCDKELSRTRYFAFLFTGIIIQKECESQMKERETICESFRGWNFAPDPWESDTVVFRAGKTQCGGPHPRTARRKVKGKERREKEKKREMKKFYSYVI